MLMSIPTILASGAASGRRCHAAGRRRQRRAMGAIAAGFAFVAALAPQHLMMRLLRSVSFTPYVDLPGDPGHLILLVIAYS
jgi:undecaprenyl-diphosphatase